MNTEEIPTQEKAFKAMQSMTDVASHLDGKVRQLERELAEAKARIAELEKLLAEQDNEFITVKGGEA